MSCMFCDYVKKVPEKWVDEIEEWDDGFGHFSVVHHSNVPSTDIKMCSTYRKMKRHVTNCEGKIGECKVDHPFWQIRKEETEDDE